jgi:hypothetical protein
MGDQVFTPTEVRADLDRLEKTLKRLSIEYEMYLSQQVRWAPMQRQVECELIIRHYHKHPPRQTTDRFRFNTLVHRFRTSLERWGRRERQLQEQGVMRRRGAGRLKKRGEDPNRAHTLYCQRLPEGSAVGDQVRDLYTAYRQARRARGQSVAPLSYAPFAGKLDRLLEQARRRAPGKPLELRVEHAGGKVSVSVRPTSRGR